MRHCSPSVPAKASPADRYTVDLHSHSAVSAGAYMDLGIIAANAKSSGYSAVFVSDLGGASSFQISSMNANRTAFEDTYTRWDMGTYRHPKTAAVR